MRDDYLRGHKIEKIDGKWFYFDTKESTVETWEQRPCGYCGLFNTKEGHDGCLGTLPEAMNACCGHGSDDDAYVQLMDGRVIKGNDAKTLIHRLSRGARR